jgi:hypothetical protein
MFQIDRTAFGLPYALRHLEPDVPNATGRACSLVYNCSKNAEIVQVCPMSGPSEGTLAAFRMPFCNKTIGLKDGAFGGQKALLDGPPCASNDQISRVFTMLCAVVFETTLNSSKRERGDCSTPSLTLRVRESKARSQSSIGHPDIFPEPRKDDKRWH